MQKIAGKLPPKQLATIQIRLASIEVVDQARVSEVKREIAENRFCMNSAIVADRLLAVAKEMLTTHKA